MTGAGGSSGRRGAGGDAAAGASVGASPPPAVVDASAMAALLFGEPEAERVAGLLEGRRLVAPTLLPYEVASVCRRKVTEGEGDPEDLLAGLALLGRMDVRLVDGDPVETARLALAAGLTAYDAAYLWLARALEAELVTLDAALARAARRL